MLGVLVFRIIFSLVVILAIIYMFKAYKRHFGVAPKILKSFFILFFFAFILYRFQSYFKWQLPSILNLPIYASMGVAAYLLLHFFVLDGIWLIRKLRNRKKKDEKKIDQNRRKFFKIFGASHLAIASVGYAQSQNIEVRKVRVNHPLIPKEFNGFKIAQVSDLHVGPTIKQRFVQDVVSLINSSSPDMVVYTGDMLDGQPDELSNDFLPIKELAQSLPSYFVTGNHEYYWGVQQWKEFFESIGVKVLDNQGLPIKRHGQRFFLAGVPDYSASRFNREHIPRHREILSSAEDKDFKILLAHQPKSCYGASKFPYHLQISGHTHGGQMFPFNFIVDLVHPVARGVGKYQDLYVYVNRGTGYWGPPNRFGMSAEITLFELYENKESSVYEVKS